MKEECKNCTGKHNIHRPRHYPQTYALSVSTGSRTIQSPLLASQGLSPNGTNEEVKLARSSQLDVRARRDAKFLVLNISSSWKCLYYMFITCQRISFIDDKNAFIIKLFQEYWHKKHSNWGGVNIFALCIYFLLLCVYFSI